MPGKTVMGVPPLLDDELLLEEELLLEVELLLEEDELLEDDELLGEATAPDDEAPPVLGVPPQAASIDTKPNATQAARMTITSTYSYRPLCRTTKAWV